jgi:hypothetical protein
MKAVDNQNKKVNNKQTKSDRNNNEKQLNNKHNIEKSNRNFTLSICLLLLLFYSGDHLKFRSALLYSSILRITESVAELRATKICGTTIADIQLDFHNSAVVNISIIF